MAVFSDDQPIFYVSLFAGIGGLDEGFRDAFPSARCILYIEREVTAAAVLAARIRDGLLDDAPIWSDLRTFPFHELAGRVDAIIGGFPCQPTSVAGRRQGDLDDRWLWPEFARAIRHVRPRIVVLENPTGILSLGWGQVQGDLAEMGFAAEWGSLTAEEAGATQERERIFALAYASGGGRQVHRPSDAEEREHGRAAERRDIAGCCTSICCQDVGHAVGSGCDGRAPEPERRTKQRIAAERSGAGHDALSLGDSLGDACGRNRSREVAPPCGAVEGEGVQRQRCRDAAECAGGGVFPPHDGDDDGWWRWIAAGGPWPALPQSEFRRLAARVPGRLDLTASARLMALGNSVVPPQAALTLRMLRERLG